MSTFTAPDHWELCQVPIGGTLVSSSVELMRLGKYIPPWATERLAALGMKPDDIDHYVFHQPSEIMVRKILDDLGIDPAKGVYTHGLYGNTASASVGVTYRPFAGGANAQARRQARARQRGGRLFDGDGRRRVDRVRKLSRR